MAHNKQFNDHDYCLKELKKSQEADHDNRERVREALLFVHKRDGQWEPRWWDANKGRPRYTFDFTTPIIDQIAGSMERSDFDIRITPAGGQSSKETAATLDGLVRHIENVSRAVKTYNASARRMAITGFDGWRVVQKYADEGFDQDLVIEKIGNFSDRVWFGHFEEEDASDCQMAWVLTGLEKSEHERKYPDSTGQSVSSDSTSNSYYHRTDLIMVGEFLYIKETPRELVLMNNGTVYEDNDEYKALVDELAEMGITEERRRKRSNKTVYSRKFDTNGWLEKEQETVFDWIPVVPCFCNFDIVEDKIIYSGAVEKIIDPQRVVNYSLSREIEEGALAPRAKYWMSEAQAEGHIDTLQTLNTNSDPVQLFNPDPELPGPPQQNGGAQINPGLRTISEAMRGIIGQSAGMFAANMGDNPGLQSGVAISRLQDKGDVGNNKFSNSREVAQAHTAKILIHAIPKVYTPGRQVRILNEDQSFKMVTIGEEMIDTETMQKVILNDLSQGTYDVTCSSGPSFKSRQSETVTAMTDLGAIDPTVIELGGDILMKNIPAPGMDQLSERKRALLLKQGAIPESQLTDEERQMMQQQAQQPPQEDPMMVAARAEEMKAQADMVSAQTKQMEVQGEQQKVQGEMALKAETLKIDQYKAQTDRFEAQIKKATALAEIQGKAASAAKAISEAEAQDIENDAAVSGIIGLMEKLGG